MTKAPKRITLAKQGGRPGFEKWTEAHGTTSDYVEYVRADIADGMLEALEGTVEALESDEWKEWEGKAILQELRTWGIKADNEELGYKGKRFMSAVRAAVTKAKGED